MKLTKLFILFFFLSLKGFSQQPQLFTLNYDQTSYCAGVSEFAIAKVYTNKGELMPSKLLQHFIFTYTKQSGNGIIILDESGKLDLSKSTEGNYTIFLNDGLEGKLTKPASFNIVIRNCK